MNIALLSPYSEGPLRGNIITAHRIARYLSQAGAETMVLPLDAHSEEEIKLRLASFSPDIIHGFHALHCGKTACRLADACNIPCVITITGSDLYHPSFRCHPDTLHALTAATAIVCFDAIAATDVIGFFSEISGRVVVIPQGVAPLSLASGDSFKIPDNAFVLLHPAAIRPVKDIEFPLRALASLVPKIDQLQLVIAGGIIDQNYADMIFKMLPDYPFARWLGEISHDRMGSLYARADVVINCSGFETMPNTLLEAMALGRPVLANNIPGNHSLIRDGETGLLYCNEEDFRRQVMRLANDRALRETCGKNAEEYVRANNSPVMEAEAHLRLYRSKIRKKP